LTFFVYCHEYQITTHPYGIEFHQQPCIGFRLRHFRCKEFYPLVLWIWNRNIAISTIVGTSSHINLNQPMAGCTRYKLAVNREKLFFCVSLKFFSSDVYNFKMWKCSIHAYYIDRCELWRFIREINSGIFTCENISFFPPELLLHSYKCGGYVPCCVTVNTHTIVNWNKFREMLLTTLTHNHHDVIDVMWRLPVWNVKIIRYLASCTLQFWSNITKISFQGKHFNYLCVSL
jgi:hypothetical protein